MASVAQGAERRTRIAFPIAIALAIAIAAVLAWTLARPSAANTVSASGTIEATQSDLSPKVQGRLTELRVADGVAVRKGQVLATLEQTDPALNLEQARQAVESARAQVAASRAAYGLQLSAYQTALHQAAEGVSIAGSAVGQAGETLQMETESTRSQAAEASAQLESAKSTYDHARAQYVRTKALVETGDEPQQALDDATMQYNNARHGVEAARENLAAAQANLRNVRVRAYALSASRSQHSQSLATLEDARAQWQLVGQRAAQLRASQAQLAQAAAAMHLAQTQLDETRVTAPFDGYVVSHNFEVGDLVAPGAALMTVADLDHPYVYVYVPETQLPKIKAGAHADIRIDGMPHRTFDGIVTEIATAAEFTPENVQTTQQRIDYLVFRVKIQLRDHTGTLKPGLPADAAIHV